MGRCPNTPVPKPKEEVGVLGRVVWNCAAAESVASFAAAAWRAAAAARDGAVDCWLPTGPAWAAAGAALSLQAADSQGEWTCDSGCQSTGRAYYAFVVLFPIVTFFSLLCWYRYVTMEDQPYWMCPPSYDND